MEEIKLSQQGKNKGKYVALVDGEDFEYLNQWKWSVAGHDGKSYAVRCDGKKTVMMSRIIMNTPGEMECDHIDHNRLNNQKHNLRNCILSDNRKNRSKSKGKTSKYKGISFHKIWKLWISQICANKKLIFLGYYKTEIEAAIAYDNIAPKYYHEFANLNFK